MDLKRTTWCVQVPQCPVCSLSAFPSLFGILLQFASRSLLFSFSSPVFPPLFTCSTWGPGTIAEVKPPLEPLLVLLCWFFDTPPPPPLNIYTVVAEYGASMTDWCVPRRAKLNFVFRPHTMLWFYTDPSSNSPLCMKQRCSVPFATLDLHILQASAAMWQHWTIYVEK